MKKMGFFIFGSKRFKINSIFRVNWEESVAASIEIDSIVTSNLTTDSPFETRLTSQTNSVNEKRASMITLYISMMIFGTVCYLFRSFSFFNVCLRISINLHDMIFRSITRAKMIFFNNNPSGRILNRFAKDINNVDSLLPNNMFEVFDVSSNISSFCFSKSYSIPLNFTFIHNIPINI